jgi:hypothetical protein
MIRWGGETVTWLKDHQDMAKLLGDIALDIGTVAGAISAAVVVIKLWTIAQEAFNVTAKANPYMLVIMAIIAAVELAYNVWTQDLGGIQEKTKSTAIFLEDCFRQSAIGIEAGFDELKLHVQEVLQQIMTWLGPVINALSKVAPSVQDAYSAAMAELNNDIDGNKDKIQELGQAWTDNTQKAVKDIQVMNDAWSKSYSGNAGQAPTADTSQAEQSYASLANAGAAAAKTLAAAANTVSAAWVGTSQQLQSELDIMKTQHTTTLEDLQLQGENVEELTAKHQMLTEELAKQKEVTGQVTQEVQAGTEAGKLAGETEDEYQKRVSDLNKTLADSQKAEADLALQVKDSQDAIEKYQDSLQGLIATLGQVEEKYNTDMAAALDNYNQKVADSTAKEQSDIQTATDTYNNAIAQRTNALMDFSKIWDDTTTTTVDPQGLIANLQDQVTQMENWQKNLQNLAGKGVSQDIIADLQTMGTGSADQVQAMTQMTSDQLTQYVALWQQKQSDAKNESTNELTQQAQDMQSKIQEIQTNTAQQLEQYKQDWVTKNQEIQDNTKTAIDNITSSLKQLDDDATAKGEDLWKNFNQGMTTGFQATQLALEQQMLTLNGLMGNSGTASTTAAATVGTNPNIPKLDTGGSITGTGLAVVHKGEEVLNTGVLSGLTDMFASLGSALSPLSLATIGGGSGPNLAIQVYCQGNITQNEQALGDIVGRAIYNKIKWQGKF